MILFVGDSQSAALTAGWPRRRWALLGYGQGRISCRRIHGGSRGKGKIDFLAGGGQGQWSSACLLQYRRHGCVGVHRRGVGPIGQRCLPPTGGCIGPRLPCSGTLLPWFLPSCLPSLLLALLVANQGLSWRPLVNMF